MRSREYLLVNLQFLFPPSEYRVGSLLSNLVERAVWVVEARADVQPSLRDANVGVRILLSFPPLSVERHCTEQSPS